MLNKLTTELRNPHSIDIDIKPIREILEIMNQEDSKVPTAIAKEIPQIERAVNFAIESFKQGGRLIYIGAGTSGRLGILDASECPPTFGVSHDLVQGLIAGGSKAITEAIEGAEDNNTLGGDDLKAISLTEKDTVIGIAASGRTPYVIGGLQYANEIGAKTVSISNNKDSEIGKIANVKIEVVTGPEIITGSTRLKAGTSQKLVLNMITTTAMIGIGKVYQNLMVDVQPTNKKLIERSKHIIMEATNADYVTAADYLKKANYNVKAAIVMILLNCTFDQAVKKLEESKGFIRNTK
ncbi:N-acetylmuramic acid 6-phosphate etherase [Oceanobacillus caeni]|uniref:N-acetylmuramic acid 6-phosphate etherase n=1 Tax=Oceanobacillus caeni TaxID=405946 RepID=A0ABR5MHG0_9BACI|nr:N-acetylmuramic acid 6-phosphate etherase [Oceanobacillus caeni]KKE78635.1 N-acetylmuramic acid-6-phosphate etherase [Bacilli bacterium VT-13-104]PZD83941.1 N-acetylmuramic acid 6-phosphate etherase [Bacilli bacterium]KPH73462.1 N-acetylmuramic acid-6-phosphate etherase [Oceanobacillus caeni]MBU8789965.1 N-acetylmuramic acid 6-phosphate etherase [Oceanobacillus caeni]MCR1834301.1 N-acetylmuramic acid 6-phosphate etherase [Oceanobacillus caeni]